MSDKSFNLPWHQHDHYWIGVFAKGGNFTPTVQQGLKNAGMQFLSAGAVALKTNRNWASAWQNIYKQLQELNALNTVLVGITQGDASPHIQAAGDHKTPADVQAIAEGMWLGDALMEGRIVCYLQPIVRAKDKIFGYESFARVRAAEGSVLGGDAIIAASKALGIEFMIDRMLQVQAIKTFVSSAFNGFLFVNFLPGFIHRPAIYLEELGNTVKSHDVVAKNIVLEFTKSETPRDLMHLKNVCEYGRSRGYSIALDDIGSVEGARKLVNEIRPDFVKIDMHLVRRIEEKSARDIVSQIVELTHQVGGAVVGEGVESEAVYQQLKTLGVDLFQGYHFSAPVPVEKAIKPEKRA